MRRFYIIPLFVFITASSAFAEGPGVFTNRSIPPPEPLMDRSVPGSAPTSTFVDPERAELIEYFNQKMVTVEGVITALDLEARSIDIDTGEAVMSFVFDEATRFQMRLKQVEPSEIKVGSKMAGLYRIKDGAHYIGRVVIMTDKYKRRRR